MGCGRTAAVCHLIHGDRLNRGLLWHTELLADTGHGVDGIIQLDLQQMLQPGHGLPKLGEELIQRRVEICDAGLMPVIHRDAAPDMDRVLTANEQSRDLGGRDAGIRGEKADAGHEPRGHGAFAFGGEEPGVGADEILLLIGKTPGGACDCVIAVAALKDIAGETVAEFGLKNIEKSVDREDRVVRFIAGVDCGLRNGNVRGRC